MSLFGYMSAQIDRSKIILRPVTVTYLEMHEPKEFPVQLPGTRFDLMLRPVSVEEYRKYYYSVGEQHFWLDRMVMPDEELHKKINAANVDIFSFYIGDEAAGYIEFVKEKNYVEILYFGITPKFIGKGFGKLIVKIVMSRCLFTRQESGFPQLKSARAYGHGDVSGIHDLAQPRMQGRRTGLCRDDHDFRRWRRFKRVVGNDLHTARGFDRLSRFGNCVKPKRMAMTGLAFRGSEHDILENLPGTSKVDHRRASGNCEGNRDGRICRRS